MSKRIRRSAFAESTKTPNLPLSGLNGRDLISEIRATTPQVLSDRQRENMSRRFMHLGRMGNLTPEKYRAQLLALKEADIPSRNTLYAWRAINQQNPLLLAGRNHRAGRKSTIDDAALYYYFNYRVNYPLATSKATYRAMKDAAKVLGWKKLHSEDRFRAIYNLLPPSQRHMFKHGSKKRFNKYGFTLPQPDGLPNDLWQCDAKKLDCYVRRVEGGEPFKPWLVSFLDHASRLIMGWAIFDHDPTTRDMLLTLKRAVLANERKPWGGLPKCIQTDNASTFGAKFTTVLGSMGIRHTYTDRGCPAQNGRIERSHRIHDEEFCDNLFQHTMWDPRGSKAPKPVRFHEVWERFEERFDLYAEKYCQLRPHGALDGLTPYEVWKSSVPDYSPDNEAAIVEKHLVVAHKNTLDVIRGAIFLDGYKYTAPELLPYSNRAVQVVYPPEGPSSGTVRAFYKGQEIGVLMRPDLNVSFAESMLAAEKQAVAKEKEWATLLRAATNRYSKDIRTSLGCQHGEPAEPVVEPPGETPPAKPSDRISDTAAEPYPDEPSES